MTFPILSIIVFPPMAAGLLLFLLPARRHREIRLVALAAAVVALGLSVFAYVSYDQTLGGYQFQEQATWIPQLGISYHVGVDGMSLPLVLLTGIVMLTGGLISWGVGGG